MTYVNSTNNKVIKFAGMVAYRVQMDKALFISAASKHARTSASLACFYAMLVSFRSD